MEIKGKRILVTGANRGLGRALAFAFAAAGAREIIAGARKPEDIEQLKADALADGAPITPVRLDVRFEEDVAAVVALGPVDILVNNATIFAKVNLPIVGTYCATKAALLSLGQALRAHLADKGVRVLTVLPSTIDTDMSRGADVPKMTKEFVAGEILRIIREEPIDPPIGDEARGILEGLAKDPLSMEQTFA